MQDPTKHTDEDIFLDLSFVADNDISELTAESGVDNDIVFKIESSKRVRNKFNWKVHSEWTSMDDALDFLHDEGYVHYDDSDLKIGQKFYFRCKRTPKSVKPYCASRYTLFIPSNRNIIQLLHNGHVHNHDDIMKGKKKINVR